MSKFYSEKQVAIAAILAGPLPAGIMIAKNYRRIGRPETAQLAIAITFCLTFLLFYFLIYISPDWLETVPNAVFTAFYGVLVFLYYRYRLQQEIENFTEDITYESNWQVVRISALWMIATLAMISVLAAFKAPYDGALHEYKGNWLYHDEVFEAHELDKVGEALIEFGHFNEDTPKAAQFIRDGNYFRLTFQSNKSEWDQADFQAKINILKSNLKDDFVQETLIVLEHYELDGRITRRVF